MKIRFYIDTESRLLHIYKHNVREDEIKDVLRNPGRTGRVKKILELRSGKHMPVDTSE